MSAVSILFTAVQRNALRAAVVMCVLVLSFCSAWAWPPTYGAEFELTRRDMDISTADQLERWRTGERVEQHRFIEHLEKRCLISKCKIIEVTGKYSKWDDFRVEYPDGWWFKVSVDPGCVEIQFKPSTKKILKAKESLINDQIFLTAKQIGLEVIPSENHHFNIGVRSAFGDDAKKFLRFFVDYANHPDLALGSLGMDLNNAPPLSVLGQDQRDALSEIVNEVNSGKLTTIFEVAEAIQNRVYTQTYKESWGSKHFQAIGLKYLTLVALTKEDVPMELRAVWGQESAEKFNLVATLIEGRIQYLNSLTTPIVYNKSAKTIFTKVELRTRFQIYAEDANVPYEEVKSLLPKSIRKAPLDDFMRSDVTAEKRLKRVEAYWDLLASSPLVQKNLNEIISDPTLKNHPEVLKIVKELKKQNPSVLRKSNRENSCRKIFQ